MSDYMRNRRGERGEEGEGFFCRFTFGQFFALLVLEVFTLFFVFYLGARYGREFLGLARPPAVASAEATGETGGQAEEPKVQSTTDPEAAQMAKDLIAKAKTPELKERISKMFEGAKQGTDQKAEQRTPPVVVVNHADDVKEAPMPVEQPGSAAEEPVRVKVGSENQDVQEIKAAEKPKTREERQAAEDARQSADAASRSESTDTSVIRVKSAENGRYSVQVGSYPQMGEATRTLDRWKVKGYPAYVMIADIPDRGRWYRVRIGGFSSHEEAAKYLKEFQSKENVEALIVMNEQ